MVRLKIFNESKNQRFKRLAADRTNKAIDKIRILGHCSNSSLYDYIEEDVKKIFNAIEKELKTTKAMFERPRKAKFGL